MESLLPISNQDHDNNKKKYGVFDNNCFHGDVEMVTAYEPKGWEYKPW